MVIFTTTAYSDQIGLSSNSPPRGTVPGLLPEIDFAGQLGQGLIYCLTFTKFNFKLILAPNTDL